MSGGRKYVVPHPKGVEHQAMEDQHKTYYVSVGAGQVLEDPQAAAFEFEIRANEEELNKLQEMFEETASVDEAEIIRYGLKPVTEGEEEMTGAYDTQIHDIYKLLYDLGTEQTKRHIESIHILEKSAEHDCMEGPC
jgi:hypothetical protein